MRRRPRAAARSPRREAKALCEAYGIAVPKEGVAGNAAEAAQLASRIGFPVVMKIVSPQILHKTEAGGVVVGREERRRPRSRPSTPSSPTRAATRRTRRIEGVQVQQMLTGGQEVIIGAVTDPAFGKLVAFGLGGILVEVLKDITFRLAPATREDALSMLDGIAAAEILRGVRGAPAVDREALAAHDRERLAAGGRLPGDLRARSESGVRHATRARPPPTCAWCSISSRSRRATGRARK